MKNFLVTLSVMALLAVVGLISLGDGAIMEAKANQPQALSSLLK